MKIWESMLAVLLCTGLVIALGLTACGDDDDDGDEGISPCDEALEQFNSQGCQNQASASVEEAQTCAVDCGVNLLCLDDCMDEFEDDISAFLSSAFVDRPGKQELPVEGFCEIDAKLVDQACRVVRDDLCASEPDMLERRVQPARLLAVAGAASRE